MISKNVIGIYAGGLALIRWGGLFADGGGLFAGGLFAGGPFAAGIIAGGLFASGLNAAPRLGRCKLITTVSTYFVGHLHLNLKA